MPPAHCTQRLQDQRADLAGFGRAASASASAARCARCSRGLAGHGEEGIRRRREHRLGQQRRVHAAVQRDVAYRQRTQRFAVVAVFQRDEFRARVRRPVVEPVERHLQRHFHARRAVVGIEHLRQRRAAVLPRREREQAFGQLHRGRVRAAGQDHVLQFPRLACDGLGDARLGVPVQAGPPARHGIEVAPAVHAHQPLALAALDRQQRQRVRVLAHLRARVPDTSRSRRATPRRCLRGPLLGWTHRDRSLSSPHYPASPRASGGRRHERRCPPSTA